MLNVKINDSTVGKRRNKYETKGVLNFVGFEQYSSCSFSHKEADTGPADGLRTSKSSQVKSSLFFSNMALKVLYMGKNITMIQKIKHRKTNQITLTILGSLLVRAGSYQMFLKEVISSLSPL
ncbi:hypothetical protein CHARACLAT_009546 [Characodon lateralis]|uniref:Uncharacterized protein n=1 Tax=Characodon lateralis TaxID=208331 RepID=A0ABU7CNY6_9TELE|nr:hypothetical protein [Characodon lateralis]